MFPFGVQFSFGIQLSRNVNTLAVLFHQRQQVRIPEQHAIHLVSLVPLFLRRFRCTPFLVAFHLASRKIQYTSRLGIGQRRSLRQNGKQINQHLHIQTIEQMPQRKDLFPVL